MAKPPNASSPTICQGDRSLATRRLLALEKQTNLDALLSHLTRFIARLFAGRPRFRLRGLVGLTVGLAIGGAVSIAGEVAVGLSGWSLWNDLMSFLRC